MLKIDKHGLDNLEVDYPGIREQILSFDGATLPAALMARLKIWPKWM
jgi:hypothetical protein